MQLVLQFHRYNKIYDFISFTKTRKREKSFVFFNFWKIKCMKRFEFIFSNFHSIIIIIFLLETDEKRNNEKLCCLGNLIPYKMMFVSTIKVKNCGRSCSSSSQSVIFQDNWKHTKATILTMCKIYNVNNTKTTDI